MNENNSYKGRSHFENAVDTKRNITQAGPAAQKIRQTKTKTGGKMKEN